MWTALSSARTQTSSSPFRPDRARSPATNERPVHHVRRSLRVYTTSSNSTARAFPKANLLNARASPRVGSVWLARALSVGCAAALLGHPRPPARCSFLLHLARGRGASRLPALHPAPRMLLAPWRRCRWPRRKCFCPVRERVSTHLGVAAFLDIYLCRPHPPLRFAPVSHKKSFEPNPFSSQYARARTPGPRRARRPLRPPPAHCRHRTAPAPPFPAKFPRGPHRPLIPAPPRPRFGQRDCSLLTRAFPFAGCYPGWSVR